MFMRYRPISSQNKLNSELNSLAYLFEAIFALKKILEEKANNGTS